MNPTKKTPTPLLAALVWCLRPVDRAFVRPGVAWCHPIQMFGESAGHAFDEAVERGYLVHKRMWMTSDAGLAFLNREGVLDERTYR